MKIAINGMGRIGRLLFRRLIEEPGIELVAINDIMPRENLLYLLKYDSVYGTSPLDMLALNETLVINAKPIQLLSEPDALKLPWKELGVDLVIECSGVYSKKEKASLHLESGAKHVLLSTTGDTDVPLLVYGYNHDEWRAEDKIVSPGGCMTNSSTPVLDILESAIGIESAQLNFLHSYTSRQQLVDAPHQDFRRGRAAAESIIPVEIDQAGTLERLIPSLKGKIAAVSTRVPVANGAMADINVVLKNKIAKEQVHAIFEEEANAKYKGVLAVNHEQLVSLDFKGNTHSCVVDATLTSIVGNHLKLIVWFDNEYGFTSRMIDWVRTIGGMNALA